MGKKFPINIETNKNTFSTTDTLVVTADVEEITTAFYPAVWLELLDGSKLYYQKGSGLSASPVPYMSGGPFVLNSAISDYPARR